MYLVRIVIHCSGNYSEVLPDSLESAERSIEEHVSLLLVELFGNVLVDEVTVADLSEQKAKPLN